MANKTIHIHLHNKVKDTLEAGASQKVIGKNISTEIKAGKDPKQAASIAYSKAKESKDASESISLSKVLSKFPEAKAFGLFDVTFMNGTVHMGSNYDLPKNLVAKIIAFVKTLVTVKDAEALSVGTKVMKSGFPGVVTKVHSGQLEGMVDVKLASGTVTVEASDLKIIK